MREASWQREISAGITTSIVTLPKAIAFGTVAFSPLGPEYLSIGVMSGMVALILGNLFSLGRSNPILINSTLSVASLMLASALVVILEKQQQTFGEVRVDVAIALLFLIVFCSGVLQVVAGMCRLGGLARYIPRPVLAGLVNGVAVLILLSQLPMLLTGKSGLEWSQIGSIAESLQAGNMVIAAVTVTVLLTGAGILRSIPPVFLAIGAGCTAYYMLSGLTGLDSGPLLGALPVGVPQPDVAIQIFNLDRETLARSVHLLPYVVGLACILSIWSLLFMSSSDSLLGKRSNGNHELIRQGLGNMLGPLFGGMAVAGNSNTLVNYSNGGRGKLSRISCATFALAVMVFMGPVISQIPMVVLSAVLVVFSVQALDKWSLKHLRLLLGGTFQGLPDLLVMLGVLSFMLLFGVLEAVGVGILVSLFLFINRMGREVIRQDESCSRLRSSVTRNEYEQELLDRYGDRIRVIEVEGALFFGTVDNVVARVEAYAGSRVKYIILDMRRITEVDGTGAEMLLHLRDHCLRQQQELLLSGVDIREADNAFLKSIGTLDVFTEQAHFVYLNEAIEAAEEGLLDSLIDESRYAGELGFDELAIISDFRPEECMRLRGYFDKLSFSPGECVFLQEEAAESLFLLARGQVNITRENDGVPPQTITSLRPGFAFGEMALKPGRLRYGTACARTPVTCYRVNGQSLEQLRIEEPELAFRFLAALSTDLSDRISQSATSLGALNI